MGMGKPAPLCQHQKINREGVATNQERMNVGMSIGTGMDNMSMGIEGGMVSPPCSLSK